MTDTTPKPFVFVLMPFEASFNDIYKLGIKPAAKGAGAYCERLDEQLFAESMLARLYNQIAKADLIVADMTGRNPKVFYEVGYAHALGQTVILLTFGNLIRANASIEISLDSSGAGGEYLLRIGVTNPHDTVADWSELGAGILLPAASTLWNKISVSGWSPMVPFGTAIVSVANA